MIDFRKKNQVMGILNVTPDSFSDGGEHFTVEKALEHALLLVKQGADLIDIGGQSTRPGYAEVAPEIEAARILPVIRELKKHSNIPISVDTYFPEVARAAIEAGADIINDIKGLDTPGMLEVLATAANVGIIIMHSRPRRKELSVAEDIQAFYQEQFDRCLDYNIAPERLCFDPGIGFGKTVPENIAILQNPDAFRFRDFPLLYGVSRKRTIQHMIGDSLPQERDYASVTASLFAAQAGVEIVRVHEVKGMVDALKVWDVLNTEHK
ncbi:dihydropteroate synthase [Enterococcus asini]|uniref:dihydropteroate synthase n=1 Tax=Enterococcus asini TaxID=57732 RepID=UPI00266BC83F|nr:dihydropteroate synthase [Enterococcus asini]